MRKNKFNNMYRKFLLLFKRKQRENSKKHPAVMEGLTFTEMRELLKENVAISKESWPANNYIFSRPAATLKSIEVSKITTLPESVKEALLKESKDVHFTSYICRFDGNQIVNGYQFTKQDMKGKDYYVKFI